MPAQHRGVDAAPVPVPGFRRDVRSCQNWHEGQVGVLVREGTEFGAEGSVLGPAVGVEKNDGEKEKIRAFLKENVAPYKMPRVIEFMDELPTSGVGKILKRELKKIMAG